MTAFTPRTGARRRAHSLIIVLILLPMALLGAYAVMNRFEMMCRADQRTLLKIRAAALADGALERLATTPPAQRIRPAGTTLFEDAIGDYGPYRATVVSSGDGEAIIEITSSSANPRYEAHCEMTVRAEAARLRIAGRHCAIKVTSSPRLSAE